MSLIDQPLSNCVKQALERYIAQLEGESPKQLYQFVLAQMEQPLLEIVLKHTNSNQCAAADILGISRNTLRKKLKTYGLDE